MTDSIIEEAAACSRKLLEGLEDPPLRRRLGLRLEILERAAWSISLEPAAPNELGSLVGLLLELRDEVVAARAAAGSRV